VSGKDGCDIPEDPRRDVAAATDGNYEVGLEVIEDALSALLT